MSLLQIDEEIDLQIDKLTSNGGRGLGRHEGFVVFVPFSAPGDLLRVKIDSCRKSFATAKIVQVIKAGKGRREPPCQYFGTCGGCEIQQVDYETQLAEKNQMLESDIRILKKYSDFKYHGVKAASEEFRYRNRIQVHKSKNKFGFFKRGSNSVVPVTDCLLAEEVLIKELEDLKNRSFKEKDRVEISLNTDGTCTSRNSNLEEGYSKFSQVNSSGNQEITNDLLGLLSGDEREILELYCGSGNFTYPIAEKCKSAKIRAVELNKESVKNAVDRLGPLSDRIQFLVDDCENFVTQDQSEEIDLLFLDPPRQGAKALCQSPLLGKVKRILYLSCNPATFTRDSSQIMENSELRLTSIRGFDLFPQTSHIEVLGEFQIL